MRDCARRKQGSRRASNKKLELIYWKISMPLYQRQEKDVQILEFKCVEFVEELLYGAFRKKPLSQ